MNSGREKWYQCLKKRRHICRGCSVIPADRNEVLEEMSVLKIQQERGKGTGIIFKLNIRNHPKEDEQKDGICGAVQIEKPTLPRTKMLTQTHQKSKFRDVRARKKLQNASTEKLHACVEY